jgi:hypothetical protein
LDEELNDIINDVSEKQKTIDELRGKVIELLISIRDMKSGEANLNTCELGIDRCVEYRSLC